MFVDLILKLLAAIPEPRDCSDILNRGGRSDGVYTAYIGRAHSPVQVYCDQTTDGGGWTVCIIAFKCAKTIAMLSHVIIIKQAQ